MHICFPKLYTVKEEWEKAKTTCNNDGGALISVLTQDDKSALDYYSDLNYNTNNFNLIWLGLRKTEATLCWDGTCDGKLRWQDGHQFVFDPIIHDNIKGDNSQDSICFIKKYIENQYIANGCDYARTFLCQITCPGESKIELNRQKLTWGR